MALYTVNINLQNEHCLVIGGGIIATRKIEKLLESGALITVISPEITDEIKQMTDENKLKWVNRPYQQGDIKGYILVIASTDVKEVNEAVYTEARQNNILVNCVDKKPYCNFYVPAIIQRGDLQIAISTSGSAPFLSKKLKKHFEKKLYNGIENDIEDLKQMRNRLQAEFTPDIEDREEAMRNLLNTTIDEIITKLENV